MTNKDYQLIAEKYQSIYEDNDDDILAGMDEIDDIIINAMFPVYVGYADCCRGFGGIDWVKNLAKDVLFPIYSEPNLKAYYEEMSADFPPDLYSALAKLKDEKLLIINGEEDATILGTDKDIIKQAVELEFGESSVQHGIDPDETSAEDLYNFDQLDYL